MYFRLTYGIHFLCILRGLWKFIKEFVKSEDTEDNAQATEQMANENSLLPCM